MELMYLLQPWRRGSRVLTCCSRGGEECTTLLCAENNTFMDPTLLRKLGLINTVLFRTWSRRDDMFELLQHYIIYMGEHSYPDLESVKLANHEMLALIIGSTDGARQATVHHYRKSFRGFSAMLTLEQAHQLAKIKSVISVFESKLHHLHTTRSWNFLGADSNGQFNQFSMDSNYDVIIGHLDSGVWPESESFSDNGFGPVPKRFKGECVTGERFTSANCNKKIIGARYYYKGMEAQNGPLEKAGRLFYRSARDDLGHGSHTASTAAGSLVKNVRVPLMGTGTARGGAPGARLALYKVCWFNLCSCADILAAYDDAINDGVDIISISVGQSAPANYFQDCFAIGSFHAFKKGILVSASAGNDGAANTVANAAPWILTVAASSIDREFITNVHLGNSNILKGYSLNQVKMEGYYGVIAANNAAAPGVPSKEASFCKRNTLNSMFIQGKIVVCTMEKWDDDKVEKGLVVRERGGVGMIVIDPDSKELMSYFAIPTSLIGLEQAQELQAYLATEQ
ncbi:hypothetical protein HHK36_016771 [Tetracentron sinense]|uniref:Uncharacterized protein n=1 Tax=Tetracentron sinense TaxID=13715 RepID=A0A835DC84_TETSI|nr:hypothetical protein HHK36_016771 [Tetracentron sinense]